MIPGMVTLRVRAEAGGFPATTELCNDILLGLRNEGTLWSDEFSVSGLREIGSKLEMQVRIFAFTNLHLEQQISTTDIAGAIAESAPYLRDILVEVISFEAPIVGDEALADGGEPTPVAPAEAASNDD
jgi:hypothetical protein